MAEEKEWPTEKGTPEATPAAQGDEPSGSSTTPGGVEPLTGERTPDESQNADIPAA